MKSYRSEYKGISPYMRGYTAFSDFGSTAINPFLHSTEDFYAWKRGYDDSKVDLNNSVIKNLQERRKHIHERRVKT